MNSSSAFSNLTVTPNNSPAPTTASKRNMNSPAAEFQQTWQDVRAEQHVKPKVEVKKPDNNTRADTPKNDDVQKKPDQSASTSSSDKKADDSSAKDQQQGDIKEKDAKADDSSQAANPVAQQTATPTPDAAQTVGTFSLSLNKTPAIEKGDLNGEEIATGKDGIAVIAGNIQDKASLKNALLQGQSDSNTSLDKASSNGDSTLSAEDKNAVSVTVNPVSIATATTNQTQADVGTDKIAEVLSAGQAKSTTESVSKTVAKDKVGLSEETTPASASTDAKTPFEKMLQTVASAAAGEQSGKDGNPQNPAANQNSESIPSVSADIAGRSMDSVQTPATRGFVVQTAVPVPVGQPQWSQAVGEKVLWLAAQNVSAAEIHLSPEDLGPMQVKVTVNQDQANVTFTSHHPVVREALDQNLGRLRDMFTDQGMNLNVDVSDKSFSRQQDGGKEQRGQGGSANVQSEEETPVAASAIMQQRLVDHYA